MKKPELLAPAGNMESLKAAIEAGADAIYLIKVHGLEEVGYGVWEGMTMEEIEKKYPEELNQWYCSPVDVAPPEGESQAQIYDRCKKALEIILSQAESGDAAVVSHGATTVFLLEILLNC